MSDIEEERKTYYELNTNKQGQKIHLLLNNLTAKNEDQQEIEIT